MPGKINTAFILVRNLSAGLKLSGNLGIEKPEVCPLAGADHCITRKLKGCRP
jgi:hypothetical protein